MKQFEIHTVGGAIHKEYWIPAEEPANFNASVGQSEVIAEFHAEGKTCGLHRFVCASLS